MKDRQRKAILRLLGFSGIILLLILAMQPLEVLFLAKKIPLLFPAGLIGLEQRNMMLIIQIAMLIFIIPVYILTFVFSWRYRSGNAKATYDPHLVDHKVAELFWWGVPFVFTVIVAIFTWIKTYDLDPYKPIESDKAPLTIQVVALQWKWLFIYPEEQIATINYIQIPTERPIHFLITADAPMNSFWIPRLGGQIYAMAGMQTQLYLIANKEGEFRGCSSQISGKGFAGMTFVTKASDQMEYDEWIAKAKESKERLDWEAYTKISQPSEYDPVQLFQITDRKLFNKIVMKYMGPMT